MPLWLRAGLILAGAFGLLLGLAKTYFEIKSWEVLVRAEQRAPDIDGSYRVHVKLYVFLAAFGFTLLVLGCLI